MWPEGDPKSLAMQRILYWQVDELHISTRFFNSILQVLLCTFFTWQYKTMQMMYEIIYKALEETGMDGKYEPQDFLNFFCLGNREAPYEICERNSVNTSNGNTPQVIASLHLTLYLLVVVCNIMF